MNLICNDIFMHLANLFSHFFAHGNAMYHWQMSILDIVSLLCLTILVISLPYEKNCGSGRRIVASSQCNNRYTGITIIKPH